MEMRIRLENEYNKSMLAFESESPDLLHENMGPWPFTHHSPPSNSHSSVAFPTMMKYHTRISLVITPWFHITKWLNTRKSF